MEIKIVKFELNRKCRLLAALVFVSGAALSVALYLFASSYETDAAQHELEEISLNMSKSIESELEVSFELMWSIEGLFNASSEVTRDEFRVFVERMLLHHNEIQALEWIPRITHQERIPYEAGVRNEGFSEFAISQRTEQGNMAPDQKRKEYYPVSYVEPLTGNEAALGFNLGSSKTRLATLEESRDSGDTLITGPITLVQEQGKQSGFLIFSPIYEGRPKGTVERQKSLLGFALGVFRIGDLVGHAVSRIEGFNIDSVALTIYDDTAGGESQLSYSNHTDSSAVRLLSTSTSISKGGRKWRLEFTTGPAFVASHKSYLPVLLLLVANLFAFFACLYIFARGRAEGARIEHEQLLKMEQLRQVRMASELNQLIDTANAPIFGVNTRLQVNEWNQAVAEITGYEKDEVLNCLFVHEFIGVDNKDEVGKILRDAMAGEETANYEIHLRTKEGVMATLLFNTTTRRDMEGNIIGVIGVGQDITELRQKEDSLQRALKMEAVGQLTGGIAHDFNNLLSIIGGNLRFLQQDVGETSVEINELFEDAMSAVADGSELTQRLLAFSRTRSLQSETKNVNESIEKFIRFLARTLGENIDLTVDLTDEDLFISIDPSQLESALLNLSINARDAMPEGGTITIGVSRYRHGDGDGDGDGDGYGYEVPLVEGDYIEVSVTDTGTGISSEALQHVFEPFFTTKEVGKGSGLGLSMVYGFTHQSDGACHVSSQPGEGTRVSMFFPEVMDNRTPDVNEEESAVESFPGAAVILVVEDEPRVRRVTLRDLKKLGYKTLQAENAAVAKAMIESGKPVDLLFSDVLMPGEMDGHMLGIWTEENYPQIKIVLTSGYSKGKADVSEGKAQPFPMIRKPYSIQELAMQIRTTLAEDQTTND